MKIKQNFNLLFLVVPVFVAGTLVIASESTPADSSALQQVAVSTLGGQYDISLTTSDVDLNFASATPAGTYASALATANLYTDSPNGYQMYFSMNDNDNHDNKLYLDGGTSADYIAPTAGSFDSPAVLSNNSWGWAMSSADVIGEQTGSFDQSYATPTPAAASKWAAVPAYGSDRLLARGTDPTAAAGRDVNLYYGALLNTATASGTYDGEILYTVLADTAVHDSMTVNPSYIDSLDTTLTLATTLYTTTTDLGTVSVTVGGSACTDVATTTSEGYLVVTCTAPNLNGGQEYPIELSVPKFGKTISGAIEYKPILRNFAITNVSESDFSTQKSFTVDTDINYTTFASFIEAPVAGTVSINNTACAGTVTVSNNNGYVRYSCSASPQNLVGTYPVKVTVQNVYDDSYTSATAANAATYAATIGSGELTISPAKVAPSTAQAVTITTDVTLGTGITPSYGTLTATINDTACTSPTASLDSSNHIKIACTAPSIAAEGTYAVSVGVGGYSYNKTSAGVYTVETPTCVNTLGGIGGTGTWQGYRAKVLNDGNCWMMDDYRTGLNWYNAMNSSSSSNIDFSTQGACPEGWWVPTYNQHNNLLSLYGTGTTLYNEVFSLSSTRYFWNSTEANSSQGYDLYVGPSYSGMDGINKSDNRSSAALRCVAP